MIDISVILLQCCLDLFNKKCSGETIKNRNKSNKELAEELENQLLEKVRKKRLTHFL